MALKLSDLTDEMLAREVSGPGQVITRTPSQIAAYRSQLAAQEAAQSAIERLSSGAYSQAPAAQANPFEPEMNRYNVMLKDLMTDPSKIQETSGYKFRVGQGQEALQRALGARGMLNSGNRLTELTKYGQDMASQEYDNQAVRLTNLAGMFGQNYNNRQSADNSNQLGWADMNSRNQIALTSLLNRGGGTAGSPVSRSVSGTSWGSYNPGGIGGNLPNDLWDYSAKMAKERDAAYRY